MKYITIEDIENYILKEIDTSFEPQIEAWADSIEDYIEQITGRVFVADEESSEKLYEVTPKYDQGSLAGYEEDITELDIDECIEVTKLSIDGEEIDDDEYLLYPANSIPKNKIRFKSTSSEEFTIGDQNIAVEAKWGYSEYCPAAIKLATIILTVGVMNYGKGSKTVRSETIGNYSVTYKDELGWQDFDKAMAILNQYKKIVI